jgi:hypothetical protein
MSAAPSWLVILDAFGMEETGGRQADRACYRYAHSRTALAVEKNNRAALAW